MPGITAGGVLECPTCKTDGLEAVGDGETTNHLCPLCRDCWHVELGWVHRVDPWTCPGCEHYDPWLAIAAALA
jgi:hypothetical protein